MERIVAARERFEEKIPVGPGGTLFVQLDRGDVEIESHDGNEVRLSGRAEGVGAERADWSVTRTARDVHVDLLLGGWLAGILAPPRVRLEARVPRDWAVDVETRGGRVLLRRVGGDCAITTSGARIDASGVGGHVLLRTSGGKIRVEDVGGDVQAETSGGKIRVRRVDGDCELETSGGSVRADDVLGRVDARTSGGSVRIRFGDLASGRVDASGGSVEIAYPEGTGVLLDARASGGRLEIARGIDVDGEAKRGEAKVRLDGGGLDLEVRASGGSIRIDTWRPPIDP